MSTIDVNDVQLIAELAKSSGLSIADVRDVIELCHGDELEVRNFLQNRIIRSEVNQRGPRGST